jgi:hypothetical protein
LRMGATSRPPSSGSWPIPRRPNIHAHYAKRGCYAARIDRA